MKPALRTGLLAAWVLAGIGVARFAHLCAPLGVHDDFGYQVWYWSLLTLVTVLYVAFGVQLVGIKRLWRWLHALASAFRWPRPATRLQLAATFVLVVWAWRSLPYLYFALGRDPNYVVPTSNIESVGFPQLFRLIPADPSIWQLCASISAVWFAIAMLLAIPFVPLARRASLSIAGAVTAALGLVVCGSWLLLRLSPLQFH